MYYCCNTHPCMFHQIKRFVTVSQYSMSSPSEALTGTV